MAHARSQSISSAAEAAIHVVIGENAIRSRRVHGRQHTRRGGSMSLQAARVGQQIAQDGARKPATSSGGTPRRASTAATGGRAADCCTSASARRSCLGAGADPAAPGQRAFDPQKGDRMLAIRSQMLRPCSPGPALSRHQPGSGLSAGCGRSCAGPSRSWTASGSSRPRDSPLALDAGHDRAVGDAGGGEDHVGVTMSSRV
jgi:hypothetical protein